MGFAVDNPNTETADQFPYLVYQALNQAKKKRFAVDNRNTETANKVGSFCNWIHGSLTHKKNAFRG